MDEQRVIGKHGECVGDGTARPALPPEPGDGSATAAFSRMQA